MSRAVIRQAFTRTRQNEIPKQADIPTPEGVAKFVTKANSFKAKELLKEKINSLSGVALKKFCSVNKQTKLL